MYITTKKRWIFCLLSAIVILSICIQGCGKKSKESVIADKPLADFQKKLLDIAIDTATAIPVNPFIKDRSRVQHWVIETCLKLDQPKRAARFADKIDNWKRGLSFADISYYLVEQGYGLEKVKPGLDLAEKIANIDHGQKWRADRIKARIVQTYISLGKPHFVEDMRKELVDFELGKMLKTEAMATSKDEFDRQIKALDAAVALQNFDITNNALYAYVELYNLFYDDPNYRSLTEERIKTAWQKTPRNIRFDVLVKLGEFSNDHLDKEQSLRLLNEAQALLDARGWSLKENTQLSAKLAALKYNMGDTEQAVKDLYESLTVFDEKKEHLLNIYRAETLCAIAETYVLIGMKDKALSVYKQALEEGMINPNIQNYAEDISTTCCSIALSGLEPDSDLWNRINDISEGLGGS